jgi:hypothetical protein
MEEKWLYKTGTDMVCLNKLQTSVVFPANDAAATTIRNG